MKLTVKQKSCPYMICRGRNVRIYKYLGFLTTSMRGMRRRAQRKPAEYAASAEEAKPRRTGSTVQP